jgi:hypothetical protein
MPFGVRPVSVAAPMSELKSNWQLLVTWLLVTALAAMVHFAPMARLIGGQ